ncbi:MAG: hypothetical protein IRZ19_07545 [Pyrinomonas methylaliphatogenes]|jgi:hypothetical protein|nr:hypothetical protein [Pyrinomonas methylaliphatogenes]
MATRTVIMAKNDMLALITMVKSEKGASITTLDPRRGHPLVKNYEPWAVVEEFRKVLRLSEENGWRVVYDGEPLWG